MLISLNKLREFVDFDFSLEELDDVLTMLGIEVEGVINNILKYDKFYVASVEECEKHPNADKLTICQVSIGESPITVVCGAPNVAKGQKVVLGLVGAVVPNGGFKLEKRKIRDVVSNGMICAQSELDMGEGSDGIWVLPEDAPVGMPFAEYSGINDIILELGLTPNKADCLSHLGIARELAAKLGKNVKLPNFELKPNDENINDYIKVNILNKQLCPRYSARVIKNVQIKDSPDWLKNHLQAIGVRPINAAVDVANYVMFELGQPLHTFDYDLIEAKEINVRTAEKNEKFITLDGSERTLDESMLVIADGKRTVAVGGVMGGKNSEVSHSTKNILLESAYFNPSSVRKTAKVLGISSDSSYRFERGTDIDGVLLSLNRAASLIAELCGGEVVGDYVDVYPEPVELKEIALRFERARKIIGVEISNDFITQSLANLGFEIIEQSRDEIKVRVPHRRNDVFGEIDLIEEVARMYNYDNITPNYVSSITFSGEGVHESLRTPELKNRLRHYFVSNGFNEILTQNMIDSAAASLFDDNAVKIANPLGEELSIMRPSSIPSILKTVNLNQRYGNSSLKLFEIGKIFKHSDDSGTHLKGYREDEVLSICLVGKNIPKQWADKDRNWDFYDLKGIIEDLSEFANLNITFKANELPVPAFSANSISLWVGKEQVGSIGYVSSNLLKKYDIESEVLIGVVELSKIYALKFKQNKYVPVSPFPSISRDLAFIVADNVAAELLKQEISANGGNLLKRVDIFDVYQGKNLEDGKKSLAYNLIFAAPDRTLVEEEVEKAVATIVAAIEEKFGATLRKI